MNQREPCNNADLWVEAGQEAHYLSRPAMLCKYELVKDREKITKKKKAILMYVLKFFLQTSRLQNFNAHIWEDGNGLKFHGHHGKTSPISF